MRDPKVEQTKALLVRLIACLDVTCSTFEQIIETLERSSASAEQSAKVAACLEEYVKTVLHVGAVHDQHAR